MSLKNKFFICCLCLISSYAFAVTNYWQGISGNKYWHDAENWSLGHVPTAAEDVYIVHTMAPCIINSGSNPECNNLTIEAGGGIVNLKTVINIHNDFLLSGEIIMDFNSAGFTSIVVDGNLEIRGELSVTTAVTTIEVAGDVTWFNNSAINHILTTGGEYPKFITQGNWTFEAGTDIHINYGTAIFTGTNPSILTIKSEESYFNNLKNSKSSNLVLVSAQSTGQMALKGELLILSDAQFHYYSNHNFKLREFNNYGLYQFHNGSIELVYPYSETILPSGNNSYYNDVIINSSGTVNLQSTTVIRGDLLIQDGTLAANNQDLEIAGNWITGDGGAFLSGTREVVFNGTDDQNCSGSTTFYTLKLNKSAGSLNFTSGNFFCSSYDWISGIFSVDGAIVTVDDLADNTIAGSYQISSGYLSIRQNPGESTDINADLNISDGTVHIFGGADDSHWASQNDITFTMSGGTLDFKDTGFAIPVTSTVNETITGGVIRTVGSVRVWRNGFNPTGGTLEFYDADDQVISVANGSNLFNLTINKTDPLRDLPQRELSIYSLTDLDINGSFLITNGVFHAPAIMRVAGNWTNNAGNAGFSEVFNLVIFDGTNNSLIYSNEMFYNLEINKTDPIFSFCELSAGQTLTTINNLTVTSGTLTMNDNSTINTGNHLMINAGAGLEAGDGSNLNIAVAGNWTNNNSSYTSRVGFSPGTSTVTFTGEDQNQIITTAAAQEVFYNLVINKSGSDNDLLVNDNLTILKNLTISGGDLVNNTADILHELYGDVNIDDDCNWNCSNGTIKFSGLSDQFFTDNGEAVFKHIIVAKTAQRSEKAERASTVIVTDRLVSVNSGNLTVESGNLVILGYYSGSGDVLINSGSLEVVSGGRLEIENNHQLAVNNGGKLTLSGDQNGRATISHKSGYYSLNIESGGVISASRAVFEYMNLSGVHLKSGAQVDIANQFYNCEFRNGLSGGNLLTISNNQGLEITGAVFPDNSWGSLANVSKTNNSGLVEFLYTDGGFQGEAYENDPNNLVNWNNLGNPHNVQITITEGNVTVNWDSVTDADYYRVYSCATADGPFTENIEGVFTGNSWTISFNENRRFFQVSAVKIIE